ncbi:hypothetical protein Tco_0545356 [Tanacetum coccineum]
MDNPDITMEEYIQLEAEKDRRHGQTFNWETATYSKVYYEDIDYLKDFEIEFLAIIYNDALTSDPKVSSEPTISAHHAKKRHAWLRYEGQEYTDEIIYNFKERLDRIFKREVNRVQVLDFEELTDEMGKAVTNRLRMDHTNAQGHIVFTSHAWRRLFKIRGPLVHKLMLKFFSTCRISDTVLELDIDSLREIASKDDLRDYWSRIASYGDFAPEKVTPTGLFYFRSMDEGTVVAHGPERQQVAVARAAQADQEIPEEGI